MGGKNSGNDEAAQARADENARQDRIRAGTSRINTIFDGGTTGTGALGAGSAFDPTKTYYNADGSVWKPTAAPAAPRLPGPTNGGFQGNNGGGGGGHDGNHGAISGPSNGGSHGGGASFGGGFGRSQAKTPAEQYADTLKNGGLFSGTSTTGGFNDAFFNKQRDAYLNYATPQLDQQYGNANKQLTFSLDRGGLLDSSVRGQKMSDLQQLYDTNKQNVADKALGYETGARTSVEDARSNLISTLNATGDAEGAAKSALARSAALTQPPAYDPLGNAFAGFTNGLGIQAAQERSYAAGGAKPLYNTGLFGNSGRVAVSGS